MKPKTKRWTQLSLCTLILMTMACQDHEMGQVDKMASDEKNSVGTDQNKMHTVPESISMDQQITDAMKDLSDRIGVAADVITVKDARSVQWGSGAMGCPKPGMNYTQALVPGIRLLLEANGTIYYYHGSTGKSLFYCPAERAKEPAYGQGSEVM